MVSQRQKLLNLAQQLDRDLRAIRQALFKPVQSEIARGRLTGPQLSVMQILAPSEGLSLKDLSQQAGLAHSTVSGIVDRLEARGLLKRETNPSDTRFSRIVVSEPVRTFMQDRLPALTTHPLADALQRAKPAERKKIADGIQALRRLIAD
jgi:DNA-binding MarR family transcriptional regulator